MTSCSAIYSSSVVHDSSRWPPSRASSRATFAEVKFDVLICPHGTNDHREHMPVEIGWYLYHADGRKIKEGPLNAEAKPLSDTHVDTLDIGGLASDAELRNLLLFLEMQVKGEIVSENLVLFARPKHIDIQRPDISTEIRENSETSFTISLSASRSALWSWLELPGRGASYSDNFIHLRPGRPSKIDISTQKPMSIEALSDRLKGQSLINTFHAG